MESQPKQVTNNTNAKHTKNQSKVFLDGPYTQIAELDLSLAKLQGE